MIHFEEDTLTITSILVNQDHICSTPNFDAGDDGACPPDSAEVRMRISPYMVHAPSMTFS